MTAGVVAVSENCSLYLPVDQFILLSSIFLFFLSCALMQNSFVWRDIFSLKLFEVASEFSNYNLNI